MRFRRLVTGSALLAPVIAGPLNSQSAIAALSAEELDATRSAVTRNPTTSVELISPQIDEFIRDSIALWDVRGVQVAVVRKRGEADGFDVETRAYGVRNHKGEPMHTDVVNIAFIAKRSSFVYYADTAFYRQQHQSVYRCSGWPRRRKHVQLREMDDQAARCLSRVRDAGPNCDRSRHPRRHTKSSVWPSAARRSVLEECRWLWLGELLHRSHSPILTRISRS